MGWKNEVWVGSAGDLLREDYREAIIVVQICLLRRHQDVLCTSSLKRGCCGPENSLRID